eukprot:752485-Hanusia_phi.AAC.3
MKQALPLACLCTRIGQVRPGLVPVAPAHLGIGFVQNCSIKDVKFSPELFPAVMLPSFTWQNPGSVQLGTGRISSHVDIYLKGTHTLLLPVPAVDHSIPYESSSAVAEERAGSVDANSIIMARIDSLRALIDVCTSSSHAQVNLISSWAQALIVSVDVVALERLAGGSGDIETDRRVHRTFIHVLASMRRLVGCIPWAVCAGARTLRVFAGEVARVAGLESRHVPLAMPTAD